MTDDVPAQITLYPPTTDIETSHWGFLAPTLWHAGLIWRDYEQVVFDLPQIKLRIWCTFTDRHAFESWPAHHAVREGCREILATSFDVVETITPFARHDPRCRCDESTSLILTGHGFGNRKSVLTCCDCLGYYPNYRTQALVDTIYSRLQSWALVSGHVYQTWLLTTVLEDWALDELQLPDSELNHTGRKLAQRICERIGKPVWYFLFVPSETRTPVCPSCGAECEQPGWSQKRFTCATCRLVF